MRHLENGVMLALVVAESLRLMIAWLWKRTSPLPKVGAEKTRLSAVIMVALKDNVVMGRSACP